MSGHEGGKTLKRFFVQAPAEWHLRLQHLALDAGTSAEKLGGALLVKAIEQAESEQRHGKKQTEPKRR
jgi:hypothetical protein